MRKLRTRILVGGAVAVFAGATALAVTSTADATTTAKTGTTLSIMAGESTIKAGQKDSISGTLLAGGSPAASRAVELYRYNYRLQKWRLIRIKLTGKAGASSLPAPGHWRTGSSPCTAMTPPPRSGPGSRSS